MEVRLRASEGNIQLLSQGDLKALVVGSEQTLVQHAVLGQVQHDQEGIRHLPKNKKERKKRKKERNLNESVRFRLNNRMKETTRTRTFVFFSCHLSFSLAAGYIPR